MSPALFTQKWSHRKRASSIERTKAGTAVAQTQMPSTKPKARVLHNDTMQHSIWGMPGSGAPNYHLGTVRRTRSLYTAGILPQEQICDKGFSGIPFRRL
ncbi:uncharacterized protein AKAME5_000718700 [Lates japonicus]|uniref:Uncharacterized protein n=1 Tax=Lates japonicus TaxID=270547 RepID=A0AAD3MI82_LATJO|nr:uncharacterized protein AKAME5_000718700 [Lates japonicus]